MMHHVQQILNAVLLLLFGLLALRVRRRAAPARRDRATLAWGMTAVYFIISGAYTTVHSLMGAAAVYAGPESILYRWVVSWTVGVNLARGVLSVAFALLMLALLVAHRRWVPRVSAAAPAVLGVTAVAGTGLLVYLSPVSLYQLATGLAVLSMLTAVILMGVLLAAVLNDSMDQLLWLALAVFTLKETISVSLMAVLAWWSMAPDAEVWYVFYWSSALMVGAMAALAARRLRLASEGRRVPALFERLHSLRRSPIS